jgi:rubredoxin
MVHRWRCRRCSFTVWSARRGAIVDAVESHLLDHHRGKLTNRDFRISWECPYCETTGQSHDESDGIARFRSHLFDHVEPLLESGVHVADDVGGTGSILVRSQAGSAGADNARIHFLSPGNIVLFVTTNPAQRIRLLDEQLDEWPAWTILVTTKDDPLAGVTGVDLSEKPLEVVRLDGRLGLSDLGETISRVLDEQEHSDGKISLEFDILSEIVEKFDLQTVFKFLHVFAERCASADALAHYYVNPRARSESTLNVLDEVFDLTITAREETFVADTRGPGDG